MQIFKQLNGKTVPWEQAQNMLENIFVKSKKQKPVVMLIDEVSKNFHIRFDGTIDTVLVGYSVYKKARRRI